MTATVALPGVWTWYNDPRVALVGSQVVIGAVSSLGEVQVSLPGGTPFTLGMTDQIDDHDNPALLVRASDQRVIAFYCNHPGNWIAYRVSTNPLDISSFAAEVQTTGNNTGAEFSYANPFQLLGESGTPIYFFGRIRQTFVGGDLCPTYIKSTDGGTTWSNTQAVFISAGQRPYAKYTKNGNNRIDFLLTNGHPDETTTSLYHAYYTGGQYFKSDGTLIASSLPIDIATHCTLIWDGNTAAGEAWNWQIVTDPVTNYPVCVYAVFPSIPDGRYRFARWTGSTWQDNEICVAGGPLYAGQPHYSGGICIDPTNTNVLYCSRQISGVHQIFRYLSVDSGVTWKGTQYTAGSQESFRPFIANGIRNLFYVNGSYTSYSIFSTNILMDKLLDISSIGGVAIRRHR